MKKGLKFTKEKLKELYIDKKLSLNQIGKKFGCNGSNIHYWLCKFDIKRRPAYRKKIHIPKTVLEDLYWNKRLSSREIAKKFGIKFGRTVRKKLENYGIKRKTVSQALTKKFKKPFCGDLNKKAFLLGLRAGDFYAKRARKSIRIQTSTTHNAQIDLLNDSFKKYGEIRKYYSRHKDRNDEWFIYVDLHESFDFLVEKPNKIPSWILENNELFYQFLTAYADCESNWNINKSHDKHFRYVFRLRTGDKRILEQIKDKLKSKRFHPLFRLENKNGDRSPSGQFNFNIYNVTLNRKKDTHNLIKKMLPLSKHSEKIRKMQFILENKDKLWNQVEPLWQELRKKIKKEILYQKSSVL